MTTMERLEQIVERTITGDKTNPEPPPASATPVTYAGRATRASAWGIVILLLTVPLLAAIATKPNKLWIIWAAVSIWSALDSRAVGRALSSRKRGVVGGKVLVLGLAAWNLLIALYAMFASSVPLR